MLGQLFLAIVVVMVSGCIVVAVRYERSRRARDRQFARTALRELRSRRTRMGVGPVHVSSGDTSQDGLDALNIILLSGSDTSAHSGGGDHHHHVDTSHHCGDYGGSSDSWSDSGGDGGCGSSFD